MSDQNKKGVNPTTSQPQSVKSFGEHKTPQDNKKGESCKSLKEAMAKFQQQHITAVKKNSNPFFKQTYADLTSVINAANHASEYGLSFSQSVMFENTLLNDGEHKQKVHMDMFVETTVYHENDDEVLRSAVPIIIKKGKEDDPQAMGSGITYAKRYALQAIMGLASDDDANLASDAENDPNKNKGQIGTISTKTSDNKSTRGGPF